MISGLKKHKAKNLSAINILSGHVRNLIGKMLNLEPQNLPNLEELAVKEHSPNLVEEESKRLRVEA